MSPQDLSSVIISGENHYSLAGIENILIKASISKGQLFF